MDRKKVDESSPLLSSAKEASTSSVQPRSALKCYGDYLTAVLLESDGRITDEQYASLDAYRAKHSVSHSDHVQILKSQGWTEEKFLSARHELPSEYLTFLQAILVDNVIEEMEAKRLAELKKKHSLSDADHLKALNSIGYSERDYLVALAKGATSRTVQRFGRSDAKIIEGDVDKVEYCRGLCVTPHLHQWWDTDPSSGQRVLVRGPGSDTRTASSLEGFYDLVVVAVVDKIVHLFSDDLTKWFEYIVLFLCVWRIWSMTTFYNTLWDADDLSMKFVMLGQMFGLLWMGITAADAFNGDGPVSFSIGFALAILPIWLMYGWAVVTGRRGFQWALITAIFTAIPPIVLFVSAVISQTYENTYFYYAWLGGILSTEFLPLITTWVPFLGRFRQPINIEHMTERYALFLLIVLGETIASLMADLPWRVSLLSYPVFLGILAGLVASFSLKWLYFDVDEEKKTHPFRRTAYHGIAWSLSHIPLSMAIAGSAAGFYGIQDSIVEYVEKELLPHNNSTLTPSLERFSVMEESPLNADSPSTHESPVPGISSAESHEILFCVGMALALLCLLLQAAVSKLHKHQLVNYKIRLSVRAAVAVAIGFLPLGTYSMGGLPLVLIVAGLMFSLAMFEIISMLPSETAHEPDFENLAHAPVESLREFVSKTYHDEAVIPDANGPHRKIVNEGMFEYNQEKSVNSDRHEV